MLKITRRNIVAWLKEIIFLYKPYLVAARKKKLPDILIIGAQKSGTTALSYNLALHPGIFMARNPLNSELKFFTSDKLWKKGVDWYMGNFTRIHCLQGAKDPRCLFLKECHSRIHSTVPDAKLIILLRNPVDRAYSQWNHYNQVYETDSKNWGWKKTDFETALKDQSEVIERGEYIDQITHLLEFFPRENIYIGISERIKSHPEAEISKILSFLEVPYMPLPFENHQVRDYPTPMNKQTRRNLYDHFQPFNERLFAFLGHSIPEWTDDCCETSFS